MAKGMLMVLLATAAAAEDRVALARKVTEAKVRATFEKAGLKYPADEVLIRAFKHEKELEVWAGPKGKPLTRLMSFPFCAASGTLGPKRKMGHHPVPEGFYRVMHFNPRSNFHLSLGVSYPNDSDRVLGEKGRLGGDIYIHGDCASIGCIAIENDPIEQVYLTALDAKVRPVLVHIFPRRLDDAGVAALENAYGEKDAKLVAFWKSLAPGYRIFEESKRPPKVVVDPKTGAYRVAAGK